MIHLASIELTSFKGIDSLRCEFDDLTTLVGVNNSGKTSVLQAVSLLVSSLPVVVASCADVRNDILQRTVDLNPAIVKLGVPGYDWLLPSAEAPFRIVGAFSNGCTVTIEMKGRGRFCYTVEVSSGTAPTLDASSEIGELRGITAKLFRPPGILPAREDLLFSSPYDGQIAQGKGDVLWRNNIWWNIQRNGQETFEPVQDLVEQHFPGFRVHDADIR